MINKTEISFFDLGLSRKILSGLNDLGYKNPSPIQKKCIPYLLKKFDVLGMAQTGSGKTAAFGLPLLNNIDVFLKFPQVLVLVPTRELAIQVAKAISSFSKHIEGVNIIAIYGGQRYDFQLRALKKGPQIVVGTPGRLLDHLRRTTLNLSKLQCLVLDEADEMLRMGFIEDVETIMRKIPVEHQTALFSATMPEPIRRIIHRFMKSPKEVSIKSTMTTRPDIKQSYWVVSGLSKDKALIRFLEVEEFDAVIIFVRTKQATLEISEVLEKNGYNSSALNGDMNQSVREKTLERLKTGKLDILIATDVAARGLDVERISLVINYDIPMDVESYIHRIGRTGRAGRTGKAILFVYMRERQLLRNIKKITKQSIIEIKLPSIETLSKKRQDNFFKNVQKQLESDDLDKYRALLEKLFSDEGLDMKTLAAALLKVAQGNRHLMIPPDPIPRFKKCKVHLLDGHRFIKVKRKNLNKSFNIHKSYSNYNQKNNLQSKLYRIEVGRKDGVEIRHIVGAISNEADINSRNIGRIKLFPYYSIIEFLNGIISKSLLKNLVNIRILNKPINIKLLKSNSLNLDRNLKRKKKYR